MSNRFTEKAEKALNNAAHLAEILGHTYIGSEHILLSLAKDKESSAASILQKCGITYDRIYDTIKEYSGVGAKSMLTPKDMTPKCRKIVENSYRLSVRYGALKIGTEHILLAILEEKESVGARILTIAGADTITVSDEVLTVLRTAEKHFEPHKSKKDGSDSTLAQYGKNLTELAKSKKLDPVIGRERETERLIRILCRKTKNNPCLIGEAGVGKTAIVEGLAAKIASGNVPQQIKDKSIFSVDLTSMVAGAKYRGDFEERIKSIINEASRNKSIILFIDEIHTIVGAGSAEGAIDAANILKPQLSRAEIQLIGATTFSEYHKYIEKDAALERRFQPLTVEEPSPEQTLEILRGLREKYEEHHSVKITDEALQHAVKLSDRYLQGRYFPDKAIDIIDEACAKRNVSNDKNEDKTLYLQEKIQQTENEKNDAVQNQDYSLALKLRDIELDLRVELEKLNFGIQEIKHRENTVTEKDIKDIINEITGIPISGLGAEIDSRTLSKKLNEEVYGQKDAIDALVMSVMRSEAGINNPERPKGVFLFIGPSGVGKTALAKLLSEELFHDKNALIRYDMSEFSEKNSVTMLIGSPPGYVGYEEGGALTEKIKRHPYSVILFDEIEKAHPEVLNLFLQIMDDGVLTDSCGRRVSFKNSYIIMTSNATGNYLYEKEAGFLTADSLPTSNEKLFDFFSPEFINRIDSIIHFAPLTHSSRVMIAEKKLNSLYLRLSELGITLRYTNDVAEYIAKRAKDKRLGARAVLRIITTDIENEISALMLSGNPKEISVDIARGNLIIEPVFENAATHTELI